jgi:hypothetical protein
MKAESRRREAELHTQLVEMIKMAESMYAQCQGSIEETVREIKANAEHDRKVLCRARALSESSAPLSPGRRLSIK